MNLRSPILLALIGLGLVGCAMSEPRYAAMQTVLEGSPKLKDELIRRCVREYKTNPAERRKTDAELARISVKLGPETVCARVANGIADGRIGYADYVALTRDRLSPNVANILRRR